jgi:hypothetical protein
MGYRKKLKDFVAIEKKGSQENTKNKTFRKDAFSD